MVIPGRERNNFIQVLALDPQLVFPGGVPGVLAAFEHGDHHNLDADRRAGSCCLGTKQNGKNSQHDQHQHEPLTEHAHKISWPLDPLDPLDLADMQCSARMRLYITACSRKNPIVPWPIRPCGDFLEKTCMKNLKINLSRSRPFSRPFGALVFLSLFAS